MTTYMREHAGPNLTLEVLAHHTGFSPYPFTRVFKQVVGVTPRAYRRDRAG